MSHLGIKTGGSNVSDNNDLKCFLDIKQAGADLLSVFSTETKDSQGYLKTTLNHDYTKQLSLTLYNIDNVTNTDFSLLIICFSVENPDGARWQLNYNIPAGKSQTQTFSIPASSNYYGTLVSIYNNKTSTTSAGVSYVPSGSVVNGVATKVLSRKVSDTSFVGTETPNITANPNYQTGAPVGGITPTAPVATKLSETSIRVSWTNTIGASKWRFKHSSVATGLVIYSQELTSGTYYDFGEYDLPIAGSYDFIVQVQVAGDSTWYDSGKSASVYISRVLQNMTTPTASLKTQDSVDFDCKATSFDQILRAFSLYKDGALYKKTIKNAQGVYKDVDIATGDLTTTTSSWFTVNGNTFTAINLPVGAYYCTFKFDGYYETANSNSISIGGKSATPSISIDGTDALKINVSSIASSGVKTVRLYRRVAQTSEVVSSISVPDGTTTANFIVTLYGVYSVDVQESGKAYSDKSNELTIVSKSDTPQSVSFTRVLESFKNTSDNKVTIKGQASNECASILVYRKSDNALVATITNFTVIASTRTFTFEGVNTLNVGDSFYIKQNEVINGFNLLLSDASPDYVMLEFNPDCTISNVVVTKGTVGDNDFIVTLTTPNPISLDYKISDSPTFGLGNIFKSGVLSLEANPSVANGKKAYITLDDVPEGSYYLHTKSTTTGATCSAVSSQFVFDISTTDITEIELDGGTIVDCSNMRISTINEVKNNDGSVTFTATVLFDVAPASGTLFYGEVVSGSVVLGKTASDGVELSSNQLSIVIPSNKVPERNTSINIGIAVNSSDSAYYGCTSNKSALTVSDTSLTQSVTPVIRNIQDNGGRIFIETCLGAKLIVYKNGNVYVTIASTTDTLVEAFNSDIPLAVGDVINAVQTCPNQTQSKLSASRTISSVCEPVSNGSIVGSEIVPTGAISKYTVTGITGDLPMSYSAEVSGGVITDGLNSDTVTVKWGNVQGKGILGITISNCNGSSQKLLTKQVTINNASVPSGLNAPRITAVTPDGVRGTGIAGMTITLYDNNNKVIKTGIKVNPSGVWFSQRVREANAYYAKGVLDGVTTEISNIGINYALCNRTKGNLLC